MSKVSVIIPSYRDPYLTKTIESVLKSSKEDIEIIVHLDCINGPVPGILNNHPNIIYTSSEENIGMRNSINISVEKATGEFIMKLDSHCDIMDGFDVILKEQTDENMVSIPSRYNLNVSSWSKYNGPIDYLFLKYPKIKKRESVFRMDLFKRKIKSKNNPMIDDIIAFQGSCWFMKKSLFNEIGGLDNNMFGSFGSEAHEISMKIWLTTDGRVVVNRNVWYAHYSPEDIWGSKPEKLRKTMIKSMNKAFSLDMLNEWPNQKRTFKSVIDKFGPFSGWPENWHTKEFIEKLKIDGII